MPSNLVSLLVILAFFVAQIYIFFCVERIEIRVALAIFSAYQIYQKSRKFRPGGVPKGPSEQTGKADNWAAPKPRNMTSMMVVNCATLVVFTLVWGLGCAVNFGTGSSRLEDDSAADFNKIVEDTEWVEQSTLPLHCFIENQYRTVGVYFWNPFFLTLAIFSYDIDYWEVWSLYLSK